MLLDGIITLLQNNGNVTALVDGRVYEDELPRGYVLPAIVVHTYGDTQEYDMAGPVEVREDQVQVDCYGNTAAETRTGYEIVRGILSGFKGVLPDGTNVQICELERGIAMPFLPNANAKGLANRRLLGFRVVSAVES